MSASFARPPDIGFRAVGIPLPDRGILVIGGGCQLLLDAPLKHTLACFGHAHVVCLAAAPCPIRCSQAAGGLQVHADADVAGGFDGQEFVFAHEPTMHMRNALVNMPLAFISALMHHGGMISGKDIRKHRDRLGETQTQFARRFNVNQSTVARWESGDLDIAGIAEVAVEYVLAELSRQAARETAE